MVGNWGKGTLISPARVSLIKFLVSALVSNLELKVTYTAESGGMFPLYFPQNISETKLFLPQFIG